MVGCVLLAAALAAFPKWSEPRAVTQGPHEHLLASYFGIDSWSPNKRYMLVLETDVNGRLPEAGERCTIGVVDLQDGNRFIPVSTTACWNFQEAAMGFWMNDDEILFNDLRDGKFKTVIMNWRTGRDVRVLPMPVSAVSEDRTWAVSVNYARLSLLRPDYGYAGPGQDPRETVPWPEDDGLWTMDLKTGETRLILSVAATRSQQPEPKKVAGKPGQPLAYHCHTVISKDGAKIFFLARSVDWFDKVAHKTPYWNTTSFTVNRDGTGLRRCFKDGWASSHFNWAPDGSHKMLVTATWNENNDPKLTGGAWSTVEFEVGRESEVRRIGAGVLDADWHCLYSPDGKFMSGETYWNRYNERPWVLVRLADGMTMPMGSFYVPPAYRKTYWRCDLHARFRPDGRQIAFNSVHEGTRQVYVRDIVPGADADADAAAGKVIRCEGEYGGHLQGVATDGESIFWSFTVKLVKTDLAGRVQAAIDVPSHHGDLCVKDGTVYVAVNRGKFNFENKAVSEVRAYAADGLKPAGVWKLPMCGHGAGGMTWADDRFFVVGGLPATRECNYVYEFSSDFTFLKRHELKTGFTLMGIQTAAFEEGKFLFGIYGGRGCPKGTIECPRNLSSFVRRRGNGDVGILRLGKDYWTGLTRITPSKKWRGEIVRVPGFPACEKSAEPVRTGKGAVRVFYEGLDGEGWKDSGYGLGEDGYSPLFSAKSKFGVFFPPERLASSADAVPAVGIGGNRSYSAPDLVRGVRRVAETGEAFALHVPGRPGDEARDSKLAEAMEAVRGEAGKLGVRIVVSNRE